eukprot:293731-Heterocapsa_arctica.AAC.1
MRLGGQRTKIYDIYGPRDLPNGILRVAGVMIDELPLLRRGAQCRRRDSFPATLGAPTPRRRGPGIRA